MERLTNQNKCGKMCRNTFGPVRGNNLGAPNYLQNTCGKVRQVIKADIAELVYDGKDSRKRESGETWLQPIEEILEHWHSVDGAKPGEWERTLKHKRRDSQYSDLLESITKEGFRAFLGCYIVKEANKIFPKREYPTFGNGHHRLAVAVDLGYRYVPLMTDAYHEPYGNLTKKPLHMEVYPNLIPIVLAEKLVPPV